MERFKDRFDREWMVEVDNSMLPAFKAAGLDLSKFPRQESQEAAAAFAGELMQLLMDPDPFGQILWTLCEDQCLAKGIDERSFARGFNADALCAATDAVLIASFDHVFRRPELRRLIREKLPQMWKNLDADVAKKLG